MSAAETSTPASPLMTPEFQDDWVPVIHRLREEDPVHWVPVGFWYVTRYDDVKMLFADERVTPDRRVWQFNVPPERPFMRWAMDNGIFAMDPERHARTRKLVTAAFRPRVVARMEDQIRATVEQFAAPLHGRTGVVDLMAEFTDPIPNAVISRITGVPQGDDEVRFRKLAQETIRGFFSFGDAEALQRAGDALMELADWVRALATERRKNPREDLISDLIQARDEDHRMSDDDVVLMITGLIGAGSETTAVGGMVSIMRLLDEPAVTERLRGDRSLLQNAVSELLRHSFGGPAGIPRYAKEDFELRGKRIQKGQMLMLSFTGANRDPSVYDDPDVFDLDRDPKDFVTFGHGPHYCLGASLARTELACMIDAALDFLPPGAALVEDQVEFQAMGIFKRPTSLPVDFGAR